MKILSGFLCLFLLLLLFGSASYIYILWNNYWQRIEKLRAESSPHHGDIGPFVGEKRRPDGHFRYRYPITPSTPSPMSLEKVLSRVSLYETQIVSQLRNAVAETGKAVSLGEVRNTYHVNFKGKLSPYRREPLGPVELACDALKKVNFQTFVRGDSFFKKLELDHLLWPDSLLSNRSFKSCAVVSSSGSLLDSKLGKAIDANDFVIRFNNAPTAGHEEDVGSKTSLRIVNSQVVGKPEFKFLSGENHLYSNVSVLVWDPAAYNYTLKEWYDNPDYPFFETFFSRRLMSPDEEMHLVQPHILWSVWDWLQEHTPEPLLPNPPSSGFLGIMLALHHCRSVNVYEYVPSMRLTKRCHYYDDEENLGCTIGDWHPLAAEKLVSLALNQADKLKVFSDGVLVIPGKLRLGNCTKSSAPEMNHGAL